MNPRLEGALQAAAKGIRVAPLAPGTKRTLVKWKHATTDVATIRKWFARWPDANVALMMGPSGDGTRRFVGGDFDHKGGNKPGLASFEAMDALYGIAGTLTTETGSGGRHAIHEVPLDAPELRNFVDGLPDYPAVDLRGDRGLLVGPGSVVNGRSYRWLNDAPIMPAPAGLLELYQSASRSSRAAAPSREPVGELDTPTGVARSIHYLRHEAPMAVEGSGGDNTTIIVACRLRDFGLSEAKALELLDEHWNHPETGGKAVPDWDLDALEGKVASAFRSATGAWGGALAENEFEALVPSPKVFRGALTDFGRRSAFVPPDELIRNTVPAVGVGFIGGQSGGLKTFCTLDLGFCVATDTPFAGRRIEKPGAVLYVAFEGRGTIEGRVIARRSLLADPDADVALMMLADFGTLSTDNDRNAFRRVLLAAADYAAARWDMPLRLVVVDTATAAGLIGEEQENDPAAWQRNVFDFFNPIAAKMQLAIGLVHHFGKAATAGLRGSSNARAGADFVLVLSCDRNEVTGETGNHFLSLSKSRTGPEGPIAAIAKREVEIGRRADGSTVTSLVLEFDTGQRPPTTTRRKLTKAAQTFVAVAGRALNADGEDIVVEGVQRRAVRRAAVRTLFMSAYGADSPREAETARKQFANAWHDAPSGWITFGHGDGEWLAETACEEFDAAIDYDG